MPRAEPPIPPELVDTLSDDPDVRREVKALALASLRQARDLLDNAQPHVQLSIVRALLPPLARSIQPRGGADDPESEQTREELQGFYADLRGYLGVPTSE